MDNFKVFFKGKEIKPVNIPTNEVYGKDVNEIRFDYLSIKEGMSNYDITRMLKDKFKGRKIVGVAESENHVTAKEIREFIENEIIVARRFCVTFSQDRE